MAQLLTAYGGQYEARHAMKHEHAVQVRLVKSLQADYLFYLFDRSTGRFSQLETTASMRKIPFLDQLISRP